MSDIFSSKVAAPPPGHGNGDDFWDVASAPVRQGTPDEDELDMAAFEAKAVPEQKSRHQVISEGIDTSPMLPVTEIRRMFDSNSKPVFPKNVFIPGKKAGLAPTTPPDAKRPPVQEPEPVEEEYVAPPEAQDSRVGVSLNQGDETATLAHGGEEEAPAEEAPAEEAQPAAEAPAAEEKQKEGAPHTRLLSDEEFTKLAVLHGCQDAIDHFTVPHKIMLMIKPNADGPVLEKPMELQYNTEHRLLMMLRKNVTRYIRLNDVIRVDASSNCIIALTKGRTSQHTKKALSFYFTTAKLPMIVVVDSEQSRDLLLKLTIFLRQLLKTEKPLEICA